MALHLFSTIPLANLATRIREIKEFSKEIFPEIEIALDDMGLLGRWISRPAVMTPVDMIPL